MVHRLLLYECYQLFTEPGTGYLYATVELT